MGIGQRFMRETQYQSMGPSDQQKGAKAPPLESEIEEHSVEIRLDANSLGRSVPVDFTELIQSRRSIREYGTRELSQVDLSYLLFATQGVKATMRGATLRTVPSAGARHAFETYLLCNSVEDLDRGLYRYVASRHSVVNITSGQASTDAMVGACLGQEFIAQAAALFILVADAYRMTYRYGERGYRYLHLDAGHVCQNLYLSAEALGYGVCAIAAFSDAEVNDLLGLDGENRFAIYLASVGPKP